MRLPFQIIWRGRTRFSPAQRSRAWNRWQTYQSSLSWLYLTTGSRGDFYWLDSDGWSELHRRGCVDSYSRLTSIGKSLKRAQHLKSYTEEFRAKRQAAC